jgi:hypothetical protein
MRNILTLAITRHLRGPAGEPAGQWVFVGDTRCFDQTKFVSFIQELELTPPIHVAVSSTNANEVRMEMLATVVPTLLELGEVRIADAHLGTFAQVLPTGVARAWSSLDSGRTTIR